MPSATTDALNDPLDRWDPLSQELAYNNYTDRMKIELPEFGDPAASGSLISVDFVENYPIVRKSLDFKNGHTASGIWTPTPGSRFAVTDIYVNTAAAGVITIYDSTNNNNNTLAKLTMAANQVFEHSYRKSFLSSTANNILKYDTQAGASGSLTVIGYEV
jgi:hypothetical protein